MKSFKVYVMVACYNEEENIERLSKEILKITKLYNTHLLIIDNVSNDNTGKIADNLSKRNKKVEVLHREGKPERGKASIDGYKYCLEKKADLIIEMDADFSHNPEYLPKMINLAKKYDVVVGSRFVKGGEDRRGIIRTLITVIGAYYLKFVLGIKLKDPTTGFRAFKREVLEKIGVDRFISGGTWATVQEALYRAALYKFKIKEIPIVFIDRDRGVSKFNLGVLIQSTLMVLILRLTFSLYEDGKQFYP